MLRSVLNNLSTTWARRPFLRPQASPRVYPIGGFNIIGRDMKLEEEHWSWYHPEGFYPARIGEVLNAHYQVLGKLGYGGHSTAWLCRDMKAHSYFTIKICESDSVPAERELAACLRINSISTEHSGKDFIRRLKDHFDVKGIAGHPHICLVHEPLSHSIETLRELDHNKRLESSMVKVIVKITLYALDFLHAEAKIIHGDLQTRNLHMSMDQDDPCLKTFEEAELIKPVDRKVYDDRIIYESRGLLMPKTPSLPQLCDLGEARFGQQSYNGILQPVPFRAPEVLLDMSWNSSVDIWNLALVTWQMLQGKLLFPTRDDRGAYSLAHHLASIVAILGPPPLDLVALNDVASQYFDKSGLWSAAAEVPQLTLESSIIKHEGEDTELFLDFMRRMLCWDPEERQSAR